MKVWRPRFSLRSLLILMILACVPLAWIGAIERENQRIQTLIERLAGRATYVNFSATSPQAPLSEWDVWVSTDPAETVWSNPPRSTLCPTLWQDPWAWSQYRFEWKRVGVHHEERFTSEFAAEVSSLGFVTRLDLEDPHDVVLFERPDSFPHLKELLLSGPGWTATLARIAGQPRRIERLWLSYSNLSDEDMRLLAKWPALESLDIYDDFSSSVQGLGGCRNLKRLVLGNQATFQATWVEIAMLSQLEVLALNLPVNDPSWRPQGSFARLPPDLAQKLPHLRELSLPPLSLTDDALDVIAQCAALERLDLSCTEITGAGLSRLAALPKLRRLNLSYCPLDRKFLPDLTLCSNLEFLDLSRIPLSGEDLEFLAKLPRLRRLELNGCQLTDEAVPALLAHPTLEQAYFEGDQFTPAVAAPLLKKFPPRPPPTFGIF